MTWRFLYRTAWVLGLMLLGTQIAAAEYHWFEDAIPGPAEFFADPWASRLTADFFGTKTGNRLYRMGAGSRVGFIREEDPAWSLEGRAGIFTRFDFSSRSFFLDTADFTGGIAWRCGGPVWGTEVYVFHHSAHWGGDVVAADSLADKNISREILRALFSRTWGGLTLYGGPRLILRSDPERMRGKAGFQGGMEFRAGRFIAGADAQVRGEFNGDTDVNAAAGLSLSPETSRYQQIIRVFAACGHPLPGELEDGYEVRAGVGMMFYDQGSGNENQASIIGK